MLDEGRKRDAAANAVLALSFAANAAQSPQSLVSSGKVEAPGVANMQRLMDPRKKRKDLDLQRVAHSARNRKLKTFKEFVEETYITEGQSREDAEKKRLAKENPDEWSVRKVGRSGEESWTTKRKKSIKGQGERRSGSSKEQTSPDVNPSKYKEKVSRIASQGKEAHHRVSLSRARELFKGKSPEEQQQIRARHARVGVYFGNDPRNMIGLSRERHTAGKGSVHREIERMDKSIKKAGQESSKVFGAIKKLKEERKKKINN